VAGLSTGKVAVNISLAPRLSSRTQRGICFSFFHSPPPLLSLCRGRLPRRAVPLCGSHRRLFTLNKVKGPGSRRGLRHNPTRHSLVPNGGSNPPSAR
jgi:hypothetical protein